MPWFEIQGYGRDTGRRRKRRYHANSADEAMNLASKDGTITETATPLPDPEPDWLPRPDPQLMQPDPAARPGSATERQKTYATALGIDFPPDISKADLSPLIDEAVQNPQDVVQALTELARRHRLAWMSYWKYGEDAATFRVVEPYELVGRVETRVMEHGTVTETDRLCVRCWQADPVPTDGERWRTFRVTRIKCVRDGGAAFEPRIPILLGTGIVKPHDEGDDPSPPADKRSASAQLLTPAVATAAPVCLKVRMR